MRLALCSLPFLLAALGAPAHAAQDATGAGGPRGTGLRDAVEAQRNVAAAQVQEDATAGRRLTAAERLELREQVRRQWFASSPRPAQMPLANGTRIMPTPVPSAAVTPVADAQSSRLTPTAVSSQRP